MGYLVTTIGRLRLPVSQEEAALTAARQQMLATDSGWLSDDLETATLDELAQFAASCRLERVGDDLRCHTDEDGDPKWSEQATVFWTALAPYVGEGRIDLEGEDDERWSYLFADGAVEQVGRNGWDGAVEQADHADDPVDVPDSRPPGRKPRTSGRYLLIGVIALGGGIFNVILGGVLGWLAIAIGVYDIYKGLRLRRSSTSPPPNY